MDRQMIEGMLGDALEREIITAKMVDGAYPPAVAVGILDGPGHEIGFGHGESQLTVILPDIGDCARFVDSCKALGGKVPLGTYGGELVSAMARELEREESAPALAALESALDSARQKGYCVFDRGIHDDVPDPGLVYLCSTYPAAVRLKDSLDSVRAQGNDPDCRTLGVYRVVDGYDYFIMGGDCTATRRRTHTPSTATLPGTGAPARSPSASPTLKRRRSRMISMPTVGRRRRRSSTTPMRGPTRSSSSRPATTGAWRAITSSRRTRS